MKKVLSIDGGGIRGIIPATVLAYIEQQTGKPISECFDFFAGTSTGGIIALGLNARNAQGNPKFSASSLVDLYEKEGSTIFSRSFWDGLSSLGGLTNEKYSAAGLEKVLKNRFGDQKIQDALKPSMVTTYDIERRKPLLLKSWKTNHHAVLMRDACRATSAAPTYFEPAYIEVNNQKRSLVDGGIFVNSPAVSATAEAKQFFTNDKDFMVVSLGTGELTRSIPHQKAVDWGLAGWALPLLSCVFDGVADIANHQMKAWLGGDFYRFQTRLEYGNDDMDDASAGNIRLLKALADELIQKDKAELDKVCNLVK